MNEEWDNALLTKGYVRSSAGWIRPAGLGTKKNPCPAQLAPEIQAGASPAAEAQLSHSVVQECETLDHQTAERQAAEEADPDHVPGVSTVEGESRPEYRITVTLYVSNRGRRDPSGALETICDTLVDARRRLSQRLTGGQVESGSRSARRRRMPDRDRTPVIAGPPPF